MYTKLRILGGVIAAIFLIVVCTKNYLDTEYFIKHAVKATGEIVNLELKENSKGTKLYTWYVLFNVNNSILEFKEQTYERVVKEEGLAVGKKIVVYYLPEDPSKARIDKAELHGGNFFESFFPIIVLSFVLGVVLPILLFIAKPLLKKAKKNDESRPKVDVLPKSFIEKGSEVVNIKRTRAMIVIKYLIFLIYGMVLFGLLYNIKQTTPFMVILFLGTYMIQVMYYFIKAIMRVNIVVYGNKLNAKVLSMKKENRYIIYNYQYEVNNQLYNGKSKFLADGSSDYIERSEVEIFYSTKNPKKSVLERVIFPENYHTNNIGFIVMGIILFFGSLIWIKDYFSIEQLEKVGGKISVLGPVKMIYMDYGKVGVAYVGCFLATLIITKICIDYLTINRAKKKVKI